MVPILFSRTKQFSGECGYGQDPEDHGRSAEPLPGVSDLGMSFTILCLGYLQYRACVTKTAILQRHALAFLVTAV